MGELAYSHGVMQQERALLLRIRKVLRCVWKHIRADVLLAVDYIACARRRRRAGVTVVGGAVMGGTLPVGGNSQCAIAQPLDVLSVLCARFCANGWW